MQSTPLSVVSFAADLNTEAWYAVVNPSPTNAGPDFGASKGIS
ncbi:hypothetical protein CGRA01v4_05648 [Colletotrichum graminicola]|nr:hypothetical protein CGRA01v4_05648 [Colletotrichum graminicola]